MDELTQIFHRMTQLKNKLEKASGEWVKHRLASGPAEYNYKIALAEATLKARAALVDKGTDKPNAEELKAWALLQCKTEYEEYCISGAYQEAAKARCQHLIAEITVEQSKLRGAKIDADLTRYD